MSLRNEKKYETFRNNLTYDAVGTQSDPGPYWRSSLPWVVDRSSLADNRKVVMGTMNATVRRLAKNPSWRAAYEEQLKVLVDSGFARKVTKEELDRWIASGKPLYYISHQMVIVPENKSTPVRCVFNSSQTFQGKSLNGSLELGPDTMNNLRGFY